jgi:hypothetical protein
MGVNLEDGVRGDCKHRCVRPKCLLSTHPIYKDRRKNVPSEGYKLYIDCRISWESKTKHNGRSTYNPSVECQFLLKSHAQWCKFFWDTCRGKLTVHREQFQGPSIPCTIRNRTCRGVVFMAVWRLKEVDCQSPLYHHTYEYLDHVH